MARNVYNKIVKGGSVSKKGRPNLYCKICSNFRFCTVESGVQMAKAWEQIMFHSRKIYYLKVSQRTILRSRIRFEILFPSFSIEVEYNKI